MRLYRLLRNFIKKTSHLRQGWSFTESFAQTHLMSSALVRSLKKDTHSGRLLDIDVVEMAGETPTPISRTALGMSPRRCFICNEEAKVCARSRKHTVLEMQEHIARLVAEYTSNEKTLKKGRYYEQNYPF